MFTIAWATWNHRNNVIFRSYTCNPASIIEQAMRCYHKTMFSNRQTDMFLQDHVIGASKNAQNSRIVKQQ